MTTERKKVPPTSLIFISRIQRSEKDGLFSLLGSSSSFSKNLATSRTVNVIAVGGCLVLAKLG